MNEKNGWLLLKLRCYVGSIVGTTMVCILFLAFSVSYANGQTCAATATNIIVDGGFETGGIPNTFWNPETSTNFGTPLCDVPSCGTGGGASPPRTGAFWTWFGGIPAAETATLGQTVTIPASPSMATLRFWMRIGTVSSPFTDVLNVRVDGAIQQSFPEPTVAEGAYTERVINLNTFANGASHAILFEYIGPTTGTGSYVVDDVTLNVCTVTAASVSISGRVFSPNGRGFSNAIVSLTDQAGVVRTARTSTFGYYRFEDVQAGQAYSLAVIAKRYNYSAQIVSVDSDLTGVDFVPEK